jgi:hypothetical protein
MCPRTPEKVAGPISIVVELYIRPIALPSLLRAKEAVQYQEAFLSPGEIGHMVISSDG